MRKERFKRLNIRASLSHPETTGGSSTLEPGEKVERSPFLFHVFEYVTEKSRTAKVQYLISVTNDPFPFFVAPQ